MELKKLFRLLVVGGAVVAGAPACGPDDGTDPSTGGNALGNGNGGGGGDAANALDGGTPNPGTGGAGSGGGVNFW